MADTIPPAGVVESDYTITSGALSLPGTLTMPAHAPGKIPVALIVAGSGPTDRNGNSPAGLRSNMYAQLAWGLARRGIATVRYDKRGLGASGKGLDQSTLSLDDYVQDVMAAARLLHDDPRFSRVVLLGHSEGAGLVLQAANRGAPVAGVAMISGTGRPIAEVLHDQFALQLDSAGVAQFDAAFQRFLRGEEVGDAPPASRVILIPQLRRFIQSMAAYDPVAEIHRAAVPVLIVQGGMDIQVVRRDADLLKAAKPSATLLFIPEASHVYKAASSSDRMAQVPLYMDPKLPLVPELVPGIANWISTLR